MTTETIPGQAIAFIIEPARPPHQPYLTIDPEVAKRRENKGDIVTPYVSKRVQATTQSTTEGDDESL